MLDCVEPEIGEMGNRRTGGEDTEYAAHQALTVP
jgi:hypothetical protein